MNEQILVESARIYDNRELRDEEDEVMMMKGKDLMSYAKFLSRNDAFTKVRLHAARGLLTRTARLRLPVPTRPGAHRPLLRPVGRAPAFMPARRRLSAGALHLKSLLRAGAGTAARAAGACPEHAPAPGQDHVSPDWQSLGRQVLLHQLVSLSESSGVPVWSCWGGRGGLWLPPAVNVRPTEG